MDTLSIIIGSGILAILYGYIAPWGKVMERSGLRYELFLFENCLKLPRKKSFFFTFFGLLRFLVFFNGLFAPLSEVGCPIFLEIRNPWVKVLERSGLRYEHFCLKIV